MGYLGKWFVLIGFLFFTGCGGNPDFMPTPEPQPVPNDLGGCMGANALLLAGGGEMLRVVDAADFDGTNDYMLRGADLTGIADGKSGILSFWYRIDGGNGVARYLFIDTGNYFQVVHSSDNTIVFGGFSAADILILNMNTSAKLSGATWLNVLASWNLATGVTHLYVNDVSDKTVVTNIDDSLNYAGSVNWGVGATTTATNKTNGCLAEFYFAPNQYLDFSDVNNRRKFISAGGKPVHLGVDGSLPTGTAPIVYLHLDDAEAVANFATNRGTGGNFTITGTLATASTSPSD